MNMGEFKRCVSEVTASVGGDKDSEKLTHDISQTDTLKSPNANTCVHIPQPLQNGLFQCKDPTL